MALTKIGSSGITANALTSLAIANGSIQAVDLADGAVTNDKLAGSITSGKITSVANTAITGLVTSAQIANVANTQITGLVTTAQLAGSITSDKITSVANTTITGRVTSSQIANTAVTAGTYGGSSNSALITVDAQGRITAASNVTASGYSGPQGFEVFNTPGTFTLPPGITAVRVTVIGGGGGSGTGTPEDGSYGYGGQGGLGIKAITGLSSPVPVTVGSGGNSPGAGGTSSFGPFLSATGGNGGNPASGGNPGNPGASPGATLNSFVSRAVGGPVSTGYVFDTGRGGLNPAVPSVGTAGRVIVEY